MGDYSEQPTLTPHLYSLPAFMPTLDEVYITDHFDLLKPEILV